MAGRRLPASLTASTLLEVLAKGDATPVDALGSAVGDVVKSHLDRADLVLHGGSTRMRASQASSIVDRQRIAFI